MVQSGTATLPELLGDRAVAFGLAAALGMTAARVGLPKKNYRKHLAAMPYRTSVFTTDTPRLLPPLTRRLNLDAEAGLQKKIQDVAKKGNLKDFFRIQEIPPDQIFKGAVFGLDGFDPFEYAGQEKLIIRVGLHRGGMLLLEKTGEHSVRLNVSTAALFKRELAMERYYLHGLQLSPLFDMEDAAEEVTQWK
ncbi:MAG: hypothetical protein DRI57_25405 [Deltaproteobacteria bacterium]|nr:MAG: hypothetical protein DRI57_25405 [Deltaproteobacteria bacterium]